MTHATQRSGTWLAATWIGNLPFWFHKTREECEEEQRDYEEFSRKCDERREQDAADRAEPDRRADSRGARKQLPN